MRSSAWSRGAMRRRPVRPALLAVLIASAALVGCDLPDAATDPPLDPTLDVVLRQTFSHYGVVPIGSVAAQDPALVELGQALMFDRILSGNRDVSCATCHSPLTHGADGLSLSVGTGGSGEGADRTLGAGRDFIPRNAPSLLNQGLRSVYLFWDGRLSGHGAGPFQAPAGMTLPQGLPTVLAAQAMLPVLDRREMRGDPGDVDVFGEPNELAELGDAQYAEIWQAVMDRLLAVPEYVELFGAAFPEVPASGLGFRHAAEAIAAFTTEAFTKADSPFDRYLAGDDAALAPDAKRGAALFFGVAPDDPVAGLGNPPAGSAGPPTGGQLTVPDPMVFAQCSSCHAGPLLGGQSFANVGAPQLGPGVGAEPPFDLGRGEVLDGQQDFYRFAFRTPPLRNVELTAPYMHSGAYATLDAAVRHYGDVPEALRLYDPSQLDAAFRDQVNDDEDTIEEILAGLDFRVRNLPELTDRDVDDLVAFLRSLTDPAAREMGEWVPERVPSGLPVR